MDSGLYFELLFMIFVFFHRFVKHGHVLHNDEVLVLLPENFIELGERQHHLVHLILGRGDPVLQVGSYLTDA